MTNDDETTTNPYAPFFDNGVRVSLGEHVDEIPDDALKALLDVRFDFQFDEGMDRWCISHPYLYEALDPDMAPNWCFYIDRNHGLMYIESDAAMRQAVLYLDHPNLQGVALDAMFELYKEASGRQ